MARAVGCTSAAAGRMLPATAAVASTAAVTRLPPTPSQWASLETAVVACRPPRRRPSAAAAAPAAARAVSVAPTTPAYT